MAPSFPLTRPSGLAATMPLFVTIDLAVLEIPHLGIYGLLNDAAFI